MLINSPRHGVEDLRRWTITQQQAETHAELRSFSKHVQRARDALLSFAGNGPCYAGTSWGKDSVVLAHLVATLTPSVPLVWVKIEPIANPDCELVRDAFLKLFPSTRYDEIASQCSRDAGGWHATGTLEHGYAEAVRRFGPRHLSGVRGEESGQRMRRMRTWGESSPGTCAPLGWWSAWDVYAYLVSKRLPIHPAYACTMGGLLDPIRLRVASLGGKRGQGHGRQEWEQRYYGAELAALDRE